MRVCVYEIMVEEIRINQTIKGFVRHMKRFEYYLKVNEELLMHFGQRTGETSIFTWIILALLGRMDWMYDKKPGKEA